MPPLDINTAMSIIGGVVMALWSWYKDRHHITQEDDLRRENGELEASITRLHSQLDEANARLDKCLDESWANRPK